MIDQGSRQPDHLRLRLIGPLRAYTNTGADVLPRSRKAQALLGILALSPPGPVPRTRLAALLWERAEPDQARNLLRGAVHELQRSLREAGPEIIEATREHLLLRREKLEIDTDAIFRAPSSFEGQSGFSHADPPTLMEGLETIGPVFNAWLSAARLNFRERVRSELQERPPAGRGPSEVHAAPRTAQPDEHPSSPVTQESLSFPTSEAQRSDDPGDAHPDLASPVLSLVRLPSIGVQPDQRHGRRGIRIGVAPLRSFGSSELDLLPAVLADEISGALAQFRWMAVLPSDTVAASLRTHGNVSAASDSLGLDYVLDGQIQSNSERIRLRIYLISAQESAIVSSFKVDKVISDVLTFQDDVAAEIAASVDMHVHVLESRRPVAARSHPPGAHELLMQAVAAVCRLDQLSFAKASSLLEQALRIEPEHVSARIGSAQFHMVAASQGWVQDPRAALQRAEEDAAIALSLDPFDARALTISGHVRSLLYQQPQDAVGLHRQALEMNPNLPFALHFAAANDLVRGDLAQAKAGLERHRQLAPASGPNFFVSSAVILLHILEGDYETAARVSRDVLHLYPNFVAAYKHYLVALGHLGLHSEAKAVRAKLLTLTPGFDSKTFLAGTPFRRSEDSDRYATGLRRAGLT